MSDAYRYSDPSVGYVLLMTPPWTPTAVTLHSLLWDAATVARRRFVRCETGMRAEGATIIEVSMSENAPWYSPTGRMWWLSSDPCGGVREVRQDKGNILDAGNDRVEDGETRAERGIRLWKDAAEQADPAKVARMMAYVDAKLVRKVCADERHYS